MKVCICMMQKNEFDLFPLWVEYHGGLFGFSNLYVFDNGSEESMTPILKRAEAKGVNIIYEYATFDDFQDKGTHIAKLIRHKDATDPADFYFPLDCDEFIGIEGNNGLVSIDQAAIANELQKHLNAQEVLLIGQGYDNHPVHPNVFSQKSRRKCFFAKDTCVKISLGFHTAKVKNSDGEKKTSIVYMHMHYKPLALLREHSIQKLVGRVASFSVPQLISHRDQKLRGCHLVDMLFFRNDEDYLRYFEDAFPAERYRNLDGFRGFLNHLQADIQSEWPAVKGSGEILMMKFKPRPPSPGELSMEPACKFTEEQGYGWLGKAGLKQINRIEFGYPDYTHVVHGREPQTFRLRLAPGLYRIEVHCVDPKGVPRKLQVSTDQHASLPLLASYGKAFAKLAFDALLPEQGDIDLVFSSPEEMWSLGELRVSFVNVPRVTQLIQDRLRVDRWQTPATELSGQGQQLYQSWVQSPSCGLAQSQSIVGASHYLDLLETAVTYFLGHQNLSGAIVDPYKGVEFQYATPCFAFAAALVASVKGDKRLLDASVKAFRKAALDLSTRSAADGHEDFYPLPLAHAFRVLSRQIDAELMAEISLPLRDFDPFATYRKPPGGRGGSGSNWNCVALAGHFLLNKFGARSSTSDLQYVEESLLAQGHFFANPNGLYMEGPATYDLFPRVWLSDMLACGYEGARAGTLRDALARAELASLFMQSPTGEWVCGGRSAQHVWADALQCALFEMGSQAAFQDGELVKSGVFKRAARRALAAVLQWRRSSGELQVVKNWTEPNVRHGFESYSSHS